MRRTRINIGYIYAVATGVICGIVPTIFQKVLTQEPIPRATALFIKFAASSLILLPFGISKLKKIQLPRHFFRKLLICSLLYIATIILIYESYRYIPTGIGVSLQYTFPLFTMVISALFFRFHCTKQNVIAMILSLAGVMFLSNGSLSSDGALIGILLALGSALTYALYFLWMEHEKLAAMDATVFVTLKMCASTILLFVYVLMTNQLNFSMSIQSFCGLSLSGVFTILASFCLTLAIRHIGSVHTSILGSIEPIVCAIAGVIFLEEKVNFKNTSGIAMVLAATILVTLSKQGRKAETE